MRENCTSGSVAGAPGNRSPYAGGFSSWERELSKLSPEFRHSTFFLLVAQSTCRLHAYFTTCTLGYRVHFFAVG